MNKVAMMMVAHELIELVNMDYADYTRNYNRVVHNGYNDGDMIYLLTVTYMILCGIGDLVPEIDGLYNDKLKIIS